MQNGINNNIDLYSLKLHWKKRICKLESRILHNDIFGIGINNNDKLTRVYQLAKNFNITL